MALETSLPKARIGDTCQIFAGYGFPERLQGRADGEIPFFKVGDISEAWKRGDTLLFRANNYITRDEATALRARPLPKNTTVFAKIGAAIALNRRALLSEPSLVDNNVMGLHPASESLDHKFLFHYVCTLKLDELSRATTVPSLRKSDIEQIEIPIPSPSQQRRIVAEIEKQFTRLDAGIAALRNVQAKLKRYRAAVLKAAYENQRPEKLSRVCRVLSGFAFKSTDFVDVGVPAVKIANVSYGRYLVEPESFLPDTYLLGFDKFRIEVGDILLALTRPITDGQVKACTYPENAHVALLNQRVAKLSPAGELDKKFLLYYLRSEVFKSQISERMPQTLQPNLSPRDLADLQIPLPLLAEQKRIVAEVERRLSVVEELEAVVSANLQRAARLRQSILQRAFRGEL
jgi:type I restriction enzyme S subunit